MNEELAVFGKDLPQVPPEEIDKITSLADDVAIWGKIAEGGIIINDKTLPEIVGQILKINTYCVRWVDKKPDKIPFLSEGDMPEGYEIRADIKVLCDHQVIGLSLSQSSARYQLGPYIRSLQARNLNPAEVLTSIRTKSVSNKYGKFAIATFLNMGKPKGIVTREENDDDGDVPY